jgi:3-dehydroquinate synthase
VLDGVARWLDGRSACAVLADPRASALHATRLRGFERVPRLELPAGEAAKGLDVLARALKFFAANGLDRGALIVTFGGGATCDLGGFAASVYMRGIDVVHCPTTLLAQVDASVGGKTAINLPAGKNLAGTFHQPRAAFADTAVLATLDEAELRSGLGEVVKSALLAPPGLFERLESNVAALLARDVETLADVVASCVRVKAGIVAIDERDFGARKVLNLGHTFAHAIERVAGFGTIPHGVAVAAGLTLALETSRAVGLLEDRELPARVAELLARLGLPSSLAELRVSTRLALEPDALLAAMKLDKKSRASQPRLVLPRAIGSLEIDVAVERAQIASSLR